MACAAGFSAGVYAVVKNTFIELAEEADTDSDAPPRALRRQRSDSDLVRADSASWSGRLSPSMGELSPPLTPLGVLPWAERRRWADLGSKDTSTCSTPDSFEEPQLWTRPGCDDVSSSADTSEDSELAGAAGVIKWPTAAGAQERSKAAKEPPTVAPQGCSLAEARQAYEAALAAAEAHQSRLDAGAESAESLFRPVKPPSPSPPPPQPQLQQTMLLVEVAVPRQQPVVKPYCHSCGLLKFDMYGNFCAYCGAPLS